MGGLNGTHRGYENNKHDLIAGELRMLLSLGQLLSMSDREERICRWAVDVTALLLDVPYAAIVLSPQKPDSSGAVYQNTGESLLLIPFARELEMLTQTGKAAALQTYPVSGLAAKGVDRLVGVRLRTIHRGLGGLMVGVNWPIEAGSRAEFILTTIANQAAVALENARRHKASNEHAERRTSYNRIVRGITSGLDLNGVFRLISSEVQILIPHDKASVALKNADGQTATVHAAAKRGVTANVDTVLPIASSIAGRVISTQKGYLTSDLEHEADFFEKRSLLKTGIRSNITTPLQDGDSCFGSLSLGSFQVGAYKEDDLLLAQEIAGLLAVAITSTRLYQGKKSAEERLSRIFDYSSDGILIIDPVRDEILDVNETTCKLLGYSRDELLPTPMSAKCPFDMAKLFAFAQSVRDRGHEWTDELTCTTKAGVIMPTEVSASVVNFEGEDCVMALVRDMTQNRRAQEGLRYSDEKWRSLVPDIILIIDSSGTIQSLNRTVEWFDLEEPIGTFVYDYVHPESRGALKGKIKQVFESGKPQFLELKGLGPNHATSWRATRIDPLTKSEGVEAVILISADTTECGRVADGLVGVARLNDEDSNEKTSFVST